MCTAYVTSVMEDFYAKQEQLLQGRRPAMDDGFMHTYHGLKVRIHNLPQRVVNLLSGAVIVAQIQSLRCHRQLHSTIRNVTGMAARYVETELWTQLLGPMLDDLDRFVWRGIIVGRPLATLPPFSHIDAFAEKTVDLTDSHEYVGVIGFSYKDIKDLGRAVYDQDFDFAQAMDIPALLLNVQQLTPLENVKGYYYC